MSAADAPAEQMPCEPPPLPSSDRLQELLFEAARLGRDDVIPALVQAGVDLEAQDSKGYTALVLASYAGHLETTALLLDLGCRPDGALESGGNTALMGVAYKGFAPIAELLIRSGASPDRSNGAGQTALMMAALFGRTEIVDLLLVSGADPLLQDATGSDAAELAGRQGNFELSSRLSDHPPRRPSEQGKTGDMIGAGPVLPNSLESDPHKVENLAKAGREDFDPNIESPA